MEKLEGGAEEALGPNQMVYEDIAFPRSAISTAQVNHSFAAFAAADNRSGQTGVGTWKGIPNDQGTVPGAVTYTGNPSHVSGRTTAIAIAANGQTVYLGTAGGGVEDRRHHGRSTRAGIRSVPTSPAPRSGR
jgi:hypothetical protein